MHEIAVGVAVAATVGALSAVWKAAAAAWKRRQKRKEAARKARMVRGNPGVKVAAKVALKRKEGQ